MKIKKISAITLSSALLLSGVLPSISHAAENVEKSDVQAPNITPLIDQGPNIHPENDENPYVVNEALFEETPTVDEMTEEQKTVFKQIVHEEAITNGGENPEIYEKVLTDFFTKGTENNFDLAASESILESQMQTEGPVQYALGLRVGVGLAGSTLNVAIGIAVGGGVGAIQAFIINKGKREAQRIFTRTVTSRLTAWGANKLAWAVGTAVAIAMDYYNIGGAIARYLDSKDYKPKNGWIDF